MVTRLRSTPDVISTERSIAHAPKIVAIGDLHGDRDMFWTVLSASGCVKIKKTKKGIKPKWTGKNSIVVCLGDTADSQRPDVKIRDTDEWKNSTEERQLQYDIINLDYCAKAKGGRVISILGNHDIFAGQNPEYCKESDHKDYGGVVARKKAYAPGGEIAKLYAETRNVIQIVGPCLFVHGSLVPEFINLFSDKNSLQTMKLVNEDIKEYLRGPRTKPPNWFEHSMYKGINPVECRRYSLGNNNKKEVNKVLKSFPGDLRFMFLGHTPHPKITRYGPVVCTDVYLSRAFGPKCKKIIAEWTEIRGHQMKRVTLNEKGWITRKALRT